jgi:hypothetical protein
MAVELRPALSGMAGCRLGRRTTRVHQTFKFSALSDHEYLSGGRIQSRSLELADGSAQLTDFGP